MTPRIFCLIGAAPGGHQRYQPFTESRGRCSRRLKNGCTRKRGGKFWDDLAVPLPTNAEPLFPPHEIRPDVEE